jgi:hypothetical protein
VPTLETKRLQLIPFSLDLKKAALNDRARLVEMLGVYVPEHWPEPDLAEALPSFIENMERAPSEPAWDWIARYSYIGPGSDWRYRVHGKAGPGRGCRSRV